MQLIEDLVHYNGGGNFKNHRGRKKGAKFYNTSSKEVDKSGRNFNEAKQQQIDPKERDLRMPRLNY